MLTALPVVDALTVSYIARYFVEADAWKHFSSTAWKGVLRSLQTYRTVMPSGRRVELGVEDDLPVPDIMFWDPHWLRERARAMIRKGERLKKKVHGPT